MGYAFISYSTKNQVSADAMRNLFKKYHIDTWMAPYDIPAGSEYAEVLFDALIGCSCLVLMLTDVSQNSQWVKKEVNIAISNGKTVIPVKLEDIELNRSMKLYLNDQQIIPVHVIDDRSVEIQKILNSVLAFVGGAKVNAAADGTASEKVEPPALMGDRMDTDPKEKIFFDMRQVRSFASCGNETTVFKVKKSADGQGISVAVNFEKTRLRTEIPEYAGVYYLKHPAIDVSKLTQISFRARSEDTSIETVWVEIKPKGKAWMHETFEFCLSSEFEEFVIDLADFQFPETIKCLEEVTFVLKPASFTNEDCLTGKFELERLSIR
jgi:hypothetical protein